MAASGSKLRWYSPGTAPAESARAHAVRPLPVVQPIAGLHWEHGAQRSKILVAFLEGRLRQVNRIMDYDLALTKPIENRARFIPVPLPSSAVTIFRGKRSTISPACAWITRASARVKPYSGR